MTSNAPARVFSQDSGLEHKAAARLRMARERKCLINGCRFCSGREREREHEKTNAALDHD